MSTPKGKGRGRGTDDTLPLGAAAEDIGRSKTLPPTDTESSAAPPPKSATFPPHGWDRDDSLVTSAKTSTVPPHESTAGTVTLSGDRVTEALAREILLRKFTEIGIAIQPDYQFHHGNTLVVLDGFDPATRIGYQYISHADADVVTDHDVATEIALKDLARSEGVQILIVHDVDAETGDDLLARIEEFFRRLGKPHADG